MPARAHADVRVGKTQPNGTRSRRPGLECLATPDGNHPSGQFDDVILYDYVMLYPTPVLAADDVRVLDEIDGMRRELRHLVRDAPARWTSGLRKFLIADAIAASNSIEGFRVSTVDVADLMEGEHDVEVSEENLAETVAYQHMMTYIQTLHDAPDFTYSKGQLNALHWMLQGHRHSRSKPAGRWRKGPVYVTDARDPSIAAYTAPDAGEVPALMTEFVDWLNAPSETHSLVRAALGHLQLVSIHPWADGNGRMSRSLQTLMIAREGFLAPEFSSIEAWLGRRAIPGSTTGSWPVAALPTSLSRTSRAGCVSISSRTTSRLRPCGTGWTGPARSGDCWRTSPTTGGWTSALSRRCTMWP